MINPSSKSRINPNFPMLLISKYLQKEKEKMNEDISVKAQTGM
mgnify:CR=1 FL=1